MSFCIFWYLFKFQSNWNPSNS